MSLSLLSWQPGLYTYCTLHLEQDNRDSKLITIITPTLHPPSLAPIQVVHLLNLTIFQDQNTFTALPLRSQRWNNFPEDRRLTMTLTAFKARSKTLMFPTAFDYT